MMSEDAQGGDEASGGAGSGGGTGQTPNGGGDWKKWTPWATGIGANAKESVSRVAAKTSSIFSQITPKITKQMGRRGWTKELIHQTVNNPHATRAATNRATGNVATAYFQKNGSYIVKDNITNEVIQISNRLDPNWIPDATIINPFIPK
jgi:hypothetical protein